MSGDTTISTHVLDTSLGAPAAHVAVVLECIDEAGHATVISNGVTNADGRILALAPKDTALSAGVFRLRFDVAGYFAYTHRESFYPEVTVAFTVGAEPQHYHVPLLLNPFGYSTYRGS